MRTPLAFFLLGLPLAAEPTASPTPDKPAAKAAEATPDEEPSLSITAHSVTVGGKVIRYHATAGFILLKQEEGKSFSGEPASPHGVPPGADKDLKKSKERLELKARVFFVAYTLDDVADPASRPVTFAFNGGPGSASIWLHMASIAPRRAVLTDEGEAPPPPYRLEDNPSTWLDRTDLVFIDPVSTGFSRPFPKESPSQFHGLKEDLASVGDFIRLYTTRNGRWLSPKLILGESYGTTRAAGLSDYLQGRYGIYVNGIILVSSCLDFKTILFTPENNDPYVDFLPSFATTAWYHRKLAPELQALSVAEVAAAARAFAARDYAPALAQGDRISGEERRRVAAGFSRLTGLPAAYVLQRRLKVSDAEFFSNLLKSEGRILGRFDARFTGARYEPGTDMEQNGPEYDPSEEAVMGPLVGTFNDYIRRDLKFESDVTYEAVANVHPWSYGDAAGGYPNTAESLRRAMTRNPYLKVWITCSYYDLATPFFGAESVAASLNLDPSVRPNLRFTYYESGHMLYVHRPSAVKFKGDFEAFLRDALTQQPVPAARR